MAELNKLTIKEVEAIKKGGKPGKYPESRRALRTIKGKKNSIAKLNAGFGNKEIGHLVARDLVEVLKKCERAETFETRLRVQQDGVAICGYATVQGYIKMNPLAGINYGLGFARSSA